MSKKIDLIVIKRLPGGLEMNIPAFEFNAGDGLDFGVYGSKAMNLAVSVLHAALVWGDDHGLRSITPPKVYLLAMALALKYVDEVIAVIPYDADEVHIVTADVVQWIHEHKPTAE